ncbi:transcriptional regulator [Mycobacterium antarcticum]|uniref:winged helix-turn-helix transcriptional regulator n=1 Tax=unclassified Mycolicibacterium TaxID=2636767 RepID=UPI0023A2FBF8|nr:MULTISPECIES: helix-turn-helix domain-containing protein [unclassified Mycolicibacterium]BDX30862.1 transcriptional regulator [Mycolicibacterium sp. TUM20985]GLP74226.1 transcriptional regulator [Mycolicibacterium sp. TUM20983]GLP80022.1 transcriptional regulator [Mycolicibacterium sp. TUM20984]
MPSRSYGQYCAIAKSLDVMGDRWTLLIVRELLDGPRRYGDLLSRLTPIATDMLAGRLRHMEAHGLVRKRELPQPVSVTVYELTDDGQALEDVIDAIARWGRPLLESRGPSEVVRPEWLVRAVRAYVRADRGGPPTTIQLVTPEGRVTVVISPDAVDVVDDDVRPDVTLTGSAESLAAAMDPRRITELVESGVLTVDGTPRAVRRAGGLFAVPRGS